MRLFRKVRKALLTENKLVKYFYYLIGEIFLVVAGILIAFQIDTWNEEKIIDKKMEQIYKSINRELKNDLGVAERIDSVYQERSNSCTSILETGLTREDFLKDPYFYFSLPLRSHTVMISPKGYENLTNNIDFVPDDLDTLVTLLNLIHVNVKQMNSKYDYRLDDFTWKVMGRWSREHAWYNELKDKKEPSEEAILYFTASSDYKNILAEYKDYLFNASISVNGILENAPKCIEILNQIENK